MAQLPKFVAVGVVATLVHAAIVVGLVDRAGWHPLVANVAGWAVALAVSYAGHHAWTFANHGVPLRTAARRFVLVSLAGFVLNEAAYAGLLGWTRIRYDVLLAIVLVLTAVATYAAGRLWVFASVPQRHLASS